MSSGEGAGCIQAHHSADMCYKLTLSFIVANRAVGAQQGLSANQPRMFVITICDVMEPKLCDHGVIKCHKFTQWHHNLKYHKLFCGVIKCHNFISMFATFCDKIRCLFSGESECHNMSKMCDNSRQFATINTLREFSIILLGHIVAHCEKLPACRKHIPAILFQSAKVCKIVWHIVPKFAIFFKMFWRPFFSSLQQWSFPISEWICRSYRHAGEQMQLNTAYFSISMIKLVSSEQVGLCRA